MSAPSAYNRYILTGLGGGNQQVVVFPDAVVSSIIVVDRGNVMPVPFYDGSIAGLLHHLGQVIPVVVLRRALGEQGVLLPENFPMVHLSALAGGLEGVGLVVDQVLESVTVSQYQPQPHHLMVDQVLDRLPLSLWQPRRWAGRMAG
ncbi:MAG: chemotaxis protein CheW [Pseudanabaenaceae cyanobacterium]